MIRIAVIVLIASAFFSPAHALSVDPWNDPEHTVLDLVNQDRARLGLGLLTADDRLHDAARAHSRDMADSNFVGHAGSDGSNAGSRAAAAGYVRPGAEADFETYWTLVVAAGDAAPQEFPMPARFAAAPVDPTVAALAAVPLPSSFWLLLAALATGLSVIRRRVDKT